MVETTLCKAESLNKYTDKIGPTALRCTHIHFTCVVGIFSMYAMTVAKKHEYDSIMIISNIR